MVVLSVSKGFKSSIIGLIFSFFLFANKAVWSLWCLLLLFRLEYRFFPHAADENHVSPSRFERDSMTCSLCDCYRSRYIVEQVSQISVASMTVGRHGIADEELRYLIPGHGVILNKWHWGWMIVLWEGSRVAIFPWNVMILSFLSNHRSPLDYDSLLVCD